jgi:hypothetical protein
MQDTQSPRPVIIGFMIAIPIALLIGSYAIKAAAYYGNLVGNLPAFIATCLLVGWLNWVIRHQKARWEILICTMAAGLVSIMLATMFGWQALVEDPAKTLVTMGILLILTLFGKFIMTFKQGK